MSRGRSKILLVTGGAKRIGKAIAISAASQGFDVVIHYQNSKAEAETTAAEIIDLGRRAFLVYGDLNCPTISENILKSAFEQAGGLDVLVSNASIFNFSNLLDFNIEELENEIRVNAFSPLIMARAFSRLVDGGVIIHLLDSRMTSYDKLHAAYHFSKRMLYDITRLLAIELAPSFRVNAVAPGLILPPPSEPMSYLESHRTDNLLHRYGSPEEIASAVMFLVNSKFITGQVIYVDGGRNLKGSVYG